MIYQSDYLKTLNEVYYNLNAYKDVFETECKLISYAKCELMNNDELEDFSIDGLYVSVINHNDVYELYYANYKITLYVYDKQIIDFKMDRV